MLWSKIIGSGGSGGIVAGNLITPHAEYETTTNAISSSGISNIPIGDESGSRYVIVGWSVLNGDFPSALTIGGINMTQAVQAGSSAVCSAIYYAKLTTGTTANLAASGLGVNDCHITIYTADLSDTGTIVDTSIADGSGNQTITISPTGINQPIVYSGATRNGVVPSLDSISPTGWTTVTPEYDYDTGTRAFYGGYGISQSSASHSFTTSGISFDTHRISAVVFNTV